LPARALDLGQLAEGFLGELKRDVGLAAGGDKRESGLPRMRLF